MSIRIGFGYDVHQLRLDHPFWLGGIQIAHSKGSLGHSDGDALIHAICDALLGAANMRDIGNHFPDTSQEYRGIDSKVILKKTLELIQDKGYSIINIDSTICLQKPKLKEYIPDMQKALSKVLLTDIDNISIKATTTESLGFVGKEKGIAAYAVVLIEKK